MLALVCVGVDEETFYHLRHVGVVSYGLKATLATVKGVPNRVLVKTAVEALCNRAVLKLDHFHAELTCLETAAAVSCIVGAFISCNSYGTKSCDMYDGAERVSAVEGAVHIVSPVIGITVCQLMPHLFTVVKVFALCVFKRTDLAFSIQPFVKPDFENK